jgi:hypothetical protein
MAVLNGKFYFSWVQRSRLCIPEAIKTVLGTWPLVFRQGKTCLSAFLRDLCGKWVSRLRREKAGRP